jgi:hypothetical protein
MRNEFLFCFQMEVLELENPENDPIEKDTIGCCYVLESTYSTMDSWSSHPGRESQGPPSLGLYKLDDVA